jgi:hypothetical protein
MAFQGQLILLGAGMFQVCAISSQCWPMDSPVRGSPLRGNSGIR